MPKARDADNEDVLAPLKRFPVPEVVFFRKSMDPYIGNIKEINILYKFLKK
jgi:hypothetical protein